MKILFYLIVSSNGGLKVYKKVPRLNWNEIAVSMSLEVPNKIFQRPSLQANITIPEEVVLKTPIDATVKDNVAEAIEQATGLKFAITVENHDKENPNA